MTDLLGTPSMDTISRVRNEKARRYLSSMRKKQPIPFVHKFPNADPSALKLLERLLAFDPKDRLTAEEALADPYFKGLAKAEREPTSQPITKLEFEFERRRVTKDDIKELIFREILEYHPQLLKDYVNGTERTNFLYPSAVDQFRRQFAHLEESSGKSAPVIPLERKHASLPRSTMVHSTTIPPKEKAANPTRGDTERFPIHMARFSQPPRVIPAKPGKVTGPVMPLENGMIKDPYDPRRLIRNLPPSSSKTALLLPTPSCFPLHTSSTFSEDHKHNNNNSYNRDAAEEQSSQHNNIPLKPSSSSPFFLVGGTKPDTTQRIPGDHRKAEIGISRIC